MNSIPLKITQLGLNVDDYVAMARNVRKILNIGENAWKGILDRANKELSDEVRAIVVTLPTIMCHDREFFREAGFKYANGPPIHGCFITAVADYLLRNQDRIRV